MIQLISHIIKSNKIQCQEIERLMQYRENDQTKALIISAIGIGITFIRAFIFTSMQQKSCLLVVQHTNIVK
ncbi:DEAD/DEAH box helicase family protein [Francisella tularensis]|uniref:DEAD/DEAH box helicase family protein n=1 Tax=Francisella tularensis TaxID=263 RepID=UPI00387817A2